MNDLTKRQKIETERRMIQNQQTSRRDFLSRSATTVAASATLTYFPWTKSALAFESKNDRPQIGVIGTGTRGSGDAGSQRKFGDVLAVCDVDLNRAGPPKLTRTLARVKPTYIRIIAAYLNAKI